MFVPCSVNSFNYFVIKYGNFCFPVLSMGYIGSLKTYLLAPFTMIGVSNNLYVYRGISIVFGIFSIIFTYKILKMLKMKNVSIFAALTFFSINASFILGTTFDWGPVAISIFLKTLFIYYAFKVMNRSKANNNIYLFVKSLLPLLIISIIGVFNKLDFVFFVFSFAVAFLINKKVRDNLTKIVINYTKIIILLSITGFGTILITAFILREKIILFLNAKSISKLTFGQKMDNLYQVLIGNSVTKVITSVQINSPFEPILLGIIVLILIFFLYLQIKHKPKYNIYEKYLITASAFAFLIIIFFGKSGGPHHMIATFPVMFIVFGIIINKLVNNQIGKLLVYCLLVVYFINSLFILTKTNQLFKKGYVRPSWSKSLIGVYSYIASELPDYKVYATDWGISNQLIMYSKGKIIVEEPFRPISSINSTKVQNKIKSLDTKNTVAIKFYNSQVFEDATKNFPYKKYKNSKIFYDGKKPIFIIYY